MFILLPKVQAKRRNVTKKRKHASCSSLGNCGNTETSLMLTIFHGDSNPLSFNKFH